MNKKYIYYKNKKYKYTIYTGMAESHQYTIYASNLKEAFIKILEIVGTPWRTDKRAGKSRTYKRLPHREGYPKDMFHYKIAWEPHLVLIRREISDLKWRKEITS